MMRLCWGLANSSLHCHRPWALGFKALQQLPLWQRPAASGKKHDPIRLSFWSFYTQFAAACMLTLRAAADSGHTDSGKEALPSIALFLLGCASCPASEHLMPMSISAWTDT